MGAHYNFGQVIDRTNNDSTKWNYMRAQIPHNIPLSDDVLPFWIADMDFKAPNELIEALQRTAQHGIFGYADTPQDHAKYATQWLADIHNWHVEDRHVLFSGGVIYSFLHSILALTDKGDDILLCQPIYAPMFQQVLLNERNLIVHEMHISENHFEIDFDQLETQITPHTKMLLWCHPHNPGGRVWTRAELERIADICIRHKIVICSNEIHSDLTFSECTHIPMASLNKEVADNTITLLSPSKTFNLGGQKIAYAVISNDNMRNKVKKVSKTLQGSHPFTNFGITAFKAVYEHGHNWYRELMIYLQHNRDFALEFFSSHIPQVRAMNPQATYLLWTDWRDIFSQEEETLSFLLEEAKVFLRQGSFFGAGGPGFMRLNFACPQSMLEEGLIRIRNALSTRV